MMRQKYCSLNEHGDWEKISLIKSGPTLHTLAVFKKPWKRTTIRPLHARGVSAHAVESAMRAVDTTFQQGFIN